ncbi:MAG TPA: inositol monophosphatase family protein [Methylomirabilota bacterium]|nr:inositol monophosphatase family protein [Methylomirabilota bacterium]
MTAPAYSVADVDARFDALEPLMRAAGAIAVAGFKSGKTAAPSMKGPQDFLTETDAAVERFLRVRIANLFPDDSFIGEEEGGSAGPSFAWVADPIDGTANFARGNAHFCISVALIADGKTLVGAILNPILDEFWIARRGAGATLNGAPIKVADTTDFAAASVELGWSPRIPNERYIDSAREILALGANIRRTGSGALGLAYVADGRQDAYVELHINAWDCLAGLLLVEEAGGVVNDFLANGGLEAGNPILASTPGIAAGLARAVGIPLAETAPDRTAA